MPHRSTRPLVKKKPAAAAPGCQLYLISPPAIDAAAFAPRLEAALAAGAVASFQLRLKDCDDQAIRAAAAVLMPLCHRFDVAFIVNDRPDLALELGADGCHIGQKDMAYRDARRMLGDDRIIGVTCHNSRHLAMIAAEAGADYVAFGAFFPSTTKEAASRADSDLLSWWAPLMEVPSVAIGGITVDNCPPLVAAGVDFLAVGGGVWYTRDGEAAAVREFSRIMADRHST